MRTRTILAAAAAFVALGSFTAVPAAAAPAPVPVVHSEITKVGPYEVRTSFSEWPLRADRSLDFLFAPANGIQGMKGRIRPVSPAGKVFRPQSQSKADGTDLARHPRALDDWGFDVVALPTPGTWRFEFTLDGPDGRGTGVLELLVGSRPGPPAALAWSLGLLPLAAVVPIGGYLWFRTRQARRRDVWTWS
ncbi:hypothetical protein FB561_5134 [Kribbella amoyensis]|uniref:Methionine-rich copper-binding protein CopC n=1 Tax=Kribbella amoyensis TaxID=996641 RepID=A0A561BYM9_9ACTN|nr:hypothetical protein [Kribbella amoyensis]TWD83963.1 hypothetical protein FB561_5134 [Kribbella amoyensis]